MDEESDVRWTARGANATAGAVLASFFPELAVPIAGGTAMVTAATDQLLASRYTRRKQVEADILASSLDAAQLSEEVFVERIISSPRIMAALERVVRASASADSRAKVRALGRYLGTMVSDEALIDPELIWIDIEERIERPHLKILTMIFAKAKSNGGSAVGLRWLQEQSGLGTLANPLVVGLENLGLIESFGGSVRDNSEYLPTEQATELLARFEAAATGMGADW